MKILKNGHISNVGELLELGVQCYGTIIDEIHKKLYEYFGKEEEKIDLPLIYNAYFSQPTKQAVMPVPEIYVGMAVVHRKFGDGKIVKMDYDGKYIMVSFSGDEKEFIFPGCFEDGFLKVK